MNARKKNQGYHMKKKILITGGYGFLGRALALKFKNNNNYIMGVGHGEWEQGEFKKYGFDNWQSMHINLHNLNTLNETYDVIIHCAGSSCVGDTYINPLQHFNKMVQSTVELLEYIRLYQTSALFIYPSSAAVYGTKEDEPIRETDHLNPISPYGYYKKLTEDLCYLYSKTYHLKISIVRFFSIYGPGLQKQLLWDASSKLCKTDKNITFWGTGDETRDWIHIEDAANLIFRLSELDNSFIIVNGASGIRTTVRSIIEFFRNELNPTVNIEFNNTVREGDPRFYLADITGTKQIGWLPNVSLLNGMSEYLTWIKRIL